MSPGVEFGLVIALAVATTVCIVRIERSERSEPQRAARPPREARAKEKARDGTAVVLRRYFVEPVRVPLGAAAVGGLLVLVPAVLSWSTYPRTGYLLFPAIVAGYLLARRLPAPLPGPCVAARPLDSPFGRGRCCSSLGARREEASSCRERPTGAGKSGSEKAYGKEEVIC